MLDTLPNIIQTDHEILNLITFGHTQVNKVSCENFGAVIFHDSEDKPYLKTLFTDSGIPHVNAGAYLPEDYTEDMDILKVSAIYRSLSELNTKYVLVTTRNDIYIPYLSDIVGRFETYGNRLLFSSKVCDESFLNHSTVEDGKNVMIDASMCFGYRDSMLSCFEKLYRIRELLSINHYMQNTYDGLKNYGMGGFVRSLVDDINESENDGKYIGYDYNNLIFHRKKT